MLQCYNCNRTIRPCDVAHEVYDMLNHRSNYICDMCFHKERDFNIIHPPTVVKDGRFTGFHFRQVIQVSRNTVRIK